MTPRGVPKVCPRLIVRRPLLPTPNATTRSDPEFQKRHAGAREHFTEVEIAEIAAIVINMNVWTRLKLAQGATPQYK